MARISRAHPMRVVLAVCAVAAFQGLFLGAPVANAGALGEVTGQVEEVASPVGQVAAAVQEAGETATAPTQEVTTPIAPPDGVTDAGSSPPVAKLGALPGQATATVAGAASTVTGAGSAAGAATRSADDAVRAAKEDAKSATGATLPPPPQPSATVDPASPTAGAPGVTVPADSTAAPTDQVPRAQRNTYVPPPANDGSTGAPLPRWVAYVWPAVALTGPYLANFAEDLRQATVHFATGGSAGPDADQGVAGVHASGGRAGDRDSSPLFSRIPSAVGHAYSSVPTSVWVYLGLLMLAVIAVALAVRREIAIGRRE